MLDVDHFKQFNDRNGHLAGDEALVMIADILKSFIRKGDIPARFGGEEFVMLLQGCSREKALRVAERIRKRISSRKVSWEEKNLTITVSIGVSCGRKGNCVNATEMLRQADVALYKSKGLGRNRVTCYSDLEAKTSVYIS